MADFHIRQRDSMSALRIIAGILIGTAYPVQAAELQTNTNVSVTIHDSHGLSVNSAPNELLEIVLFASHTHIHLKISNTTKKGLTLWRPYCPEGDRAMTIEFRETGSPDRIFRGGTGYDYTGGMGIPKVLTLAPGDDLIVNVDFLSEWTLPVTLKAGEVRELEMRAVYRSEPLAGKRMLGSKDAERVWTGTATSKWSKVRVVNRTGAPVEAKSNR